MGLLKIDWDINNVCWQKDNDRRSEFHKPLLVVCAPALLRMNLVRPKKSEIAKEFRRLRKRSRDSIKKAAQNDPVLSLGLKFLDNLVPPTREQLFEAASRLVDAGAKNRHGQRYEWSERIRPDSYHYSKAHHKRIPSEVPIDMQIEAFLAGDFECATYEPVELTDGDLFANRRYCMWSALPGWIRSLYRTKNGSRLVGLDGVCLFPCIVGKLFFDATGERCAFLEGDVHRKLADALFSGDRARAKAAHNKFWNTRESRVSGDVELIADFIRVRFPKVWEFRRALNGRMRVKERGEHTQLFWTCVDVEACLIECVMRELDKMGIPVGQCFDCIYVAEEHVKAAENVFGDRMNELGILTTASVSKDAYETLLKKALAAKISADKERFDDEDVFGGFAYDEPERDADRQGLELDENGDDWSCAD